MLLIFNILWLTALVGRYVGNAKCPTAPAVTDFKNTNFFQIGK